MNIALASSSRRMIVLTTTRVSARKFTSLRPVLATGSHHTYNDHGEANKQTWKAAATAAAAVLAGGALLGPTSVANCDYHPSSDDHFRKKTNVVDPQTYPALDVVVRAEETVSSTLPKEDNETASTASPAKIQKSLTATSQQKDMDDSCTGVKPQQQEQRTQATSPTEDRQKMRLEEQKQSIAEEKKSIAAGGTVSPQMTLEEWEFEKATKKAKQHSGGLKIFGGNGNLALSLEICRYLGINLGKATVGRFADGEANIVIHENVRGKDCYVIQPTCPPVNDNIMELLLMVSTLRRASARRITVVIPYYGYARQDRKMQARVPISAADVARLIESMGVDRVIAVDLHCGQIQGFFGPRVPVDNLDGGIVGLDYFGSKDLHNPVVVSPDAGGVYRAKKFKEGLMHKYDMHNLGLAMIVKQRARAGLVDTMDLVGDVNNCDCILVDDMIDTAGTLCKAADVLIENGARRVFAFASHGLLSGPGNDRLANSKMEEIVILNTIPTSPQREANEKLTMLSVAPLLAQAIFNVHAKKSLSALFK